MSFDRRALARRCVVLSLASCIAVEAAAQSPLRIPAAAPQPAAVTVDESVREALDHNLTLLAERYGVSVANARVLSARLRPNPVFTYNALIPDATIFDNNVNPFENVFRTDVVVEGGGKRERRIEVAEQARSVAELQLLNTMRTIVFDVESAFIDVVLAKANLALARESLEAFNGIVRVNTERVRSGDLSQMELARSRLAALQFQNEVRQQESRLAVARHRLKTALGRTGDEPLDVTGDLRRDAPALPLDAARRIAFDRRPDLQALRRDQARSEADIRLQIASGQVDYTVSGEFHRQRAPHDVVGNQYGVYVSVPVPIFNRNQGEIERARQESGQIDARIRALEADVTHDVQAAYETCMASRDVLDTVETQMVKQARDVRAATEYAYRLGEASFVELLDATRAFNETMQTYNEARAEYARSLYALDSASGAPQTRVTP